MMTQSTPPAAPRLSAAPNGTVTGGDRFVDAEEFCRLAVSREALVRDDDTDSGIRGLRDVTTGVRYLCKSEQLDDHAVIQPPPANGHARG